MDEGFKPHLRALKRWQPEVRKELRTELKASAELIAGGARRRADQHSKKTAGTIKVRTEIRSKGVGVQIRAGSSAVPEAGLLELGNRGGRKKGSFRHPVFGDRGTWVEQKMYPYLAPEAKHRLSEVTKRIKAAVARASETVKL